MNRRLGERVGLIGLEQTDVALRGRGGRGARLTAALLLIVLAVAALHGCLYIPRSSGLPDVADAVGDAESNKPIRVGVSTREDVLDRFGSRYNVGPHENIRYTWEELKGQWVGLCYPGWPEGARYRTRSATFHFDDRGVLKDHNIRTERED